SRIECSGDMRYELYGRGVDTVVSDELDRNEIARPKAPARRDKCINLIACAQAVGTGIGRGPCDREVECRAVGNAIELLQLICERHDLSSVGRRIRGEGSLPGIGAIRGAIGG